MATAVDRSGMAVAVRVDRGLFPVHLDSHYYVVAFQFREVIHDPVITGCAWRPWQMIGPWILNTVRKLVQDRGEGLLDRLVIEQLATHTPVDSDVGIAPLVIFLVIVQVGRQNCGEADIDTEPIRPN
jgi:hypothetical protein